MGKKIVFGLTLLVSMALLVSGCSNAFTPSEVKKGTVWEVKKIKLIPNNLTELPGTEKIGSEEITVNKMFFCLHSNGKVYYKYIGKGDLLFKGKNEIINGGESYDINTADKKMTIGGTVFSYILEGGELTLRNNGQIFGVYKSSSEPEFSN